MSAVLADTSIWVAHFRRANAELQALASADRLLCHPLVVLELACGTPPAPRQTTLSALRQLRQATQASLDETLALVEGERLFDAGCGAVDMALLAAVRLTPGALLWTLDKPLQALARRLGVAHAAAPH